MTLEKITRRSFTSMLASAAASDFLHAKRECGDRAWLAERSAYIIEGVVEKQIRGWDPSIKIKMSDSGISSWYNTWRGYYTQNFIKIDNYIKGKRREGDNITILNDGTNQGNDGYPNSEEFYLEPGKRYRLSVMESEGNFFVPCHDGIEELK